MTEALQKLLEKVDEKTVLSVVGPTATGKTALALEIAEKLLVDYPNWAGIDIISADSRQVFVDLPIVSGADVPPAFSTETDRTLPYPFFERVEADNRITRLHGLGIVVARAQWSVADFLRLVQAVLASALAVGRGVILVGGTGLYHAQVFNQDLAILPGPDEVLRAELVNLAVPDLQAKLADLAPERLEAMNDSDRANSRRLVRAIEQVVGAQELAQSDPQPQSQSAPLLKPAQHLVIACQAEIEVLEKRIEARIEQRLAAGALEEVQALLVQFVDSVEPEILSDFITSDQFSAWPILTTTGVRELGAHLAGQVDLETARANWLTRERQYARSQQTWWRSHQVDLELELV